MDHSYQLLIQFNFEANLLYAASVLKKKKIEFKTESGSSFNLLVRPEDYQKATEIIAKLDLDESPVSDESDGYIDGYKEWTDKQYVNGYFTGGKIPYWMNSKVYAQYFGLYFLGYGLFILTAWFFQLDRDTQLWAILPYTVCGVLMVNKGFKKQAKP